MNAKVIILVSTGAEKIINSVKAAIRNSPTGVSFVSIKGYENSKGEISNNRINVGMDYEKCKTLDIATLENLDLTTVKTKTDLITLEKARTELINAFISPNKNMSNAQADAYTHLCKGVKCHNETGELYIYGYREHKEVLVKGEYPVVNSKPLTIAKDELRKLLRTGKFTNFKVSNISNMRLNGDTLEF